MTTKDASVPLPLDEPHPRVCPNGLDCPCYDRPWTAPEPTQKGDDQATCGAFGCDEQAVVHGIRGEEWVPGDYCAEHGKDIQPVERP